MESIQLKFDSILGEYIIIVWQHIIVHKLFYESGVPIIQWLKQ